MAITSYEIDNYRVYHYNQDNGYQQTAVINCYYDNAFKGSLYFYQEGASIPASSKTSAGYLYLRFSGSQLGSILDTLRQEKPLYIGFNDTNLWGGLSTSNEPIGEEEGV
ncbi:hypothetical protein [Celerinatantimonas sp. YJH-8]|uniref:hypothetical protein n=1 Tax=Celerinatantimonas sp. YJH-8 TaxID=3228714 RepID=UPI0038CB4FF7